MESSSNKVKTLSSSKSFNIPERDLSSILKHSTKPLSFLFVCLFVYYDYYPCVIFVLWLYCIMIVLYYDSIVLSLYCIISLFPVILCYFGLAHNIHPHMISCLILFVCSIDLFRRWLLLLALIVIIIIINQYHHSSVLELLEHIV